MEFGRYDRALEYVTSHLSLPALLGALAEEAAELAAAALKLQRIEMGESPTPVTKEEAIPALLEEIGDVQCCIDALSWPLFIGYGSDIRPRSVDKAIRWADRVWDKLHPEDQAKAGEAENGAGEN